MGNPRRDVVTPMFRKSRTWTVALALASAAAVYVIADKDAPAPLQHFLSPRIETGPADPATSEVAPIFLTEELDESISDAQLSSEKSAATIKRTLIEIVAPKVEVLATELVERGLAPEDSERLAQRYIEGIADCLLEAAHEEHEVRGKPEGDEMNWMQTMVYIGLNRVQSAALPCVANISQQAGIPLPADFGTAGSRADDIAPETPSPPWAPEMEARVRDYIASYQWPAIKTVIVKCIDAGCNVTLVGRDIRIFDLEFDVFAEQNGFKHAVLRGDSAVRFVWLQR